MQVKELQAFLGRNQQRMQAVLRDRFGLVLRAETRELPIYAHVLAKGGIKLTPSPNLFKAAVDKSRSSAPWLRYWPTNWGPCWVVR